MKLIPSALRFLILTSAVIGTSFAIKVGDTIPDKADLHFGFPPEKINVKERVAGKNVIMVGLPGAFTPT